MKRLCKGVCLLLVLVVVGIGIYQAYFFFLRKAYPMEYQDTVSYTHLRQTYAPQIRDAIQDVQHPA